MAITVQLLFNTPQREVASLIKDRLERCASAHLVSGFVTVDGVAAIADPIRANPAKLAAFVVGSGTYRAFEAFDGLIGDGVPQDRLFVHLGHTRSTGGGARHRFYRYHPMLHSKIYLMEMGDGTTCAFIGSHNVTCFAMLGLNGEAGVLLEGPSDSAEFGELRQHIEESRRQAVPYSPTMKEALTWWTTQFVDGLRTKVNDAPRDEEAKKTIVVLSVKGDDPLPETGDLIYFEIPEGVGNITSLQAEVHIYIFYAKPVSPSAGLSQLGQARTSLWCKTKGLELEEGGAELKTDWYIENKDNPRLLRAPHPFRPTPSPGMQQVRVKAWKQVYGDFEYLFGRAKQSWIPVFDDEETAVQLAESDRSVVSSLDLIPPEDKEWYLVKHLRSAEGDEPPTAYERALVEASPESGSYVLISNRRRKKEKKRQDQKRPTNN